MDSSERIETLERELHDQKAGADAIKATLDQILQRLNTLDMSQTQQQPPAPPPQAPLSPQTTAAPQAIARSRLKPASPPDFDGDRTKGRAFLNSCTLYMQLCASEFANDQARIHWVLTFMKSGRASTFADRVLRSETRTPGLPRYASWNAFRTVFVETFCPENEATHAILRLESEKYFQGKRTVDEYVDEFEDLIDLSGYTDEIAIVIKFRRGLNPAIQDKIAESGADRPGDTDAEAWYKMARRYDQNRLANEAFHSSSSRRTASSTTTSVSASRNTFNRVSFATPTTSTASPAASHFSRPPPRPLPPGVPMDIDASKAKQLPQTCYRCGQAGHVSRECPKRFDVRHMTLDEREELLMNLLAEKDAAIEGQPQSEQKDDEKEVPNEDFASRDG
jgi:Retrotransposon gag protein/Zinc knuckle